MLCVCWSSSFLFLITIDTTDEICYLNQLSHQTLINSYAQWQHFLSSHKKVLSFISIVLLLHANVFELLNPLKLPLHSKQTHHSALSYYLTQHCIVTCLIICFFFFFFFLYLDSKFLSLSPCIYFTHILSLCVSCVCTLICSICTVFHNSPKEKMIRVSLMRRQVSLWRKRKSTRFHFFSVHSLAIFHGDFSISSSRRR